MYWSEILSVCHNSKTGSQHSENKSDMEIYGIFYLGIQTDFGRYKTQGSYKKT